MPRALASGAVTWRTAASAEDSIGRSRVVSTTRSSCSWPSLALPTMERTSASTQSTKYCARWLDKVRDTRTGWAKAPSRWAGVMAWVATISSSTTVARRSARAVSEMGL